MRTAEISGSNRAVRVRLVEGTRVPICARSHFPRRLRQMALRRAFALLNRFDPVPGFIRSWEHRELTYRLQQYGASDRLCEGGALG